MSAWRWMLLENSKLNSAQKQSLDEEELERVNQQFERSKIQSGEKKKFEF